MRRRDFISILGSAAAAWPLAARAQESGRTYRLGALMPAPRQTPAVHAMFDELSRNGFIEGQNLLVIPGDLQRRALLAFWAVRTPPSCRSSGQPNSSW
jgi:hypothetical protein